MTGPDAFQDLLLEYSQQTKPAERARIENELWEKYGVERTVLVLDMSGFSLLSRKYGIVHYLSMVRRMQLTAGPVVRRCGGKVVKFEADNCFALFEQPLEAVRAAIGMQLAFDAANILTPSEMDIRISCGIDFGRILVIGEENTPEDCFGDPVNRASKLGEDVANSGEIIITRDALAIIPAAASVRSREIEI